MRVKTDARRAAILEAAWAAFREHGFERTSMSEISARVGGSKATLYSYFKSKEELFFAALDEVVADQSEQTFSKLEQAGPLRERLLGFARGYMALRMSDDVVAVDRILISEADRSSLGEHLRAEYIMPKRQKVADLIAREMAAGQLRPADPTRAAAQYMALVESDVLERRHHGERGITPEMVEASIVEGVDTFLRAYRGPAFTE